MAFILNLFCDFDGCQHDWLESDDIDDATGSRTLLENYAISEGWVELPSGQWLCKEHGEAHRMIRRVKRYIPEFDTDL